MPRKLRLLDWLGRMWGRGLTTDEPAVHGRAAHKPTERERRAAESILGDERLTDDLDDAPAQALLDWGVACAERVAQGTAELSAALAKDTSASRLRTVRRLMRRVNNWIGNRQTLDAERDALALAKIVELAATVYGPAFDPPNAERQAEFLRGQALDHPTQFIDDLRTFIEDAVARTATDQRGKDDKKADDPEILQ
jgi:hypothetical protein